MKLATATNHSHPQNDVSGNSTSSFRSILSFITPRLARKIRFSTHSSNVSKSATKGSKSPSSVLKSKSPRFACLRQGVKVRENFRRTKTLFRESDEQNFNNPYDDFDDEVNKNSSDFIYFRSSPNRTLLQVSEEPASSSRKQKESSDFTNVDSQVTKSHCEPDELSTSYCAYLDQRNQRHTWTPNDDTLMLDRYMYNGTKLDKKDQTNRLLQRNLSLPKKNRLSTKICKKRETESADKMRLFNESDILRSNLDTSNLSANARQCDTSDPVNDSETSYIDSDLHFSRNDSRKATCNNTNFVPIEKKSDNKSLLDQLYARHVVKGSPKKHHSSPNRVLGIQIEDESSLRQPNLVESMNGFVAMEHDKCFALNESYDSNYRNPIESSEENLEFLSPGSQCGKIIVGSPQEETRSTASVRELFVDLSYNPEQEASNILDLFHFDAPDVNINERKNGILHQYQYAEAETTCNISGGSHMSPASVVPNNIISHMDVTDATNSPSYDIPIAIDSTTELDGLSTHNVSNALKSNRRVLCYSTAHTDQDWSLTQKILQGPNVIYEQEAHNSVVDDCQELEIPVSSTLGNQLDQLTEIESFGELRTANITLHSVDGFTTIASSTSKLDESTSVDIVNGNHSAVLTVSDQTAVSNDDDIGALPCMQRSIAADSGFESSQKSSDSHQLNFSSPPDHLMTENCLPEPHVLTSEETSSSSVSLSSEEILSPSSLDVSLIFQSENINDLSDDTENRSGDSVSKDWPVPAALPIPLTRHLSQKATIIVGSNSVVSSPKRPHCLPVIASYPSPKIERSNVGNEMIEFDNAVLPRSYQAHESHVTDSTIDNGQNEELSHPLRIQIANKETTEILSWLRWAGFPQYAQLYEDGILIDVNEAIEDHEFLDDNSKQALITRLIILNDSPILTTSGVFSAPKHDGDDSEEEDQCALSEHWKYQYSRQRWVRRTLKNAQYSQCATVGSTVGNACPGVKHSLPVKKLKRRLMMRSGSKPAKTPACAINSNNSAEFLSTAPNNTCIDRFLATNHRILPDQGTGIHKSGEPANHNNSTTAIKVGNGTEIYRPKGINATSPTTGLAVRPSRKSLYELQTLLSEFGIDSSDLSVDPICPSTPLSLQPLVSSLPSSCSTSPKAYLQSLTASDKVSESTSMQLINALVELEDTFIERENSKDKLNAMNDDADSVELQNHVDEVLSQLSCEKDICDDLDAILEDVYRNIKAFRSSATKTITDDTLSKSHDNMGEKTTPSKNRFAIERPASDTPTSDITETHGTVEDSPFESMMDSSEPFLEELRDSGIGCSMNRERRQLRIRWNTFFKAESTEKCDLSPEREKPVWMYSATQILLARKAAFLNLTGLLEKYGAAKTDLNWSTLVRNGYNHPSNHTPRTSHVFGSSLLECAQTTGFPLPLCIIHAIRYLTQFAPNTVGIFRKSGSKTRIQHLKEAFEKNSDCTSFDKIQPFDIADIIKLFFREMPECLLTNALSDIFLSIHSDLPSGLQINAYRAALLLLPDENRHVLEMLMGLCSKFSKHASANQMPASNLAICFAPCLFNLTLNSRTTLTPKSMRRLTANSNKSLKDAVNIHVPLQKIAHECLAFMIQNADELFVVSEDLLGRSQFTVHELGNPVNFEYMMAGKRYLNFVEGCFQGLLKEIRSNSTGWIPSDSGYREVDLSYKKLYDGSPLRLWKCCVDVSAKPFTVLNRVLNERHVWDANLISFHCIEKLNDSTDVVRYVQSEMEPVISVEFVELRSWRQNQDSNVAMAACASVNHPVCNNLVAQSRGVTLANRCHVTALSDSRSRLTIMSRVDYRGRSPEWYSRVYGRLCSRQAYLIQQSFQKDVLSDVDLLRTKITHNSVTETWHPEIFNNMIETKV